jgi:hypothetical protein
MYETQDIFKKPSRVINPEVEAIARRHNFSFANQVSTDPQDIISWAKANLSDKDFFEQINPYLSDLYFLQNSYLNSEDANKPDISNVEEFNNYIYNFPNIDYLKSSYPNLALHAANGDAVKNLYTYALNKIVEARNSPQANAAYDQLWDKNYASNTKMYFDPSKNPRSVVAEKSENLLRAAIRKGLPSNINVQFVNPDDFDDAAAVSGYMDAQSFIDTDKKLYKSYVNDPKINVSSGVNAFAFAPTDTAAIFKLGVHETRHMHDSGIAVEEAELEKWHSGFFDARGLRQQEIFTSNVDNVKLVENFLKYIPMFGKGYKNIKDVINDPEVFGYYLDEAKREAVIRYFLSPAELNAFIEELRYRIKTLNATRPWALADQGKEMFSPVTKEELEAYAYQKSLPNSYTTTILKFFKKPNRKLDTEKLLPLINYTAVSP